MTGTRMRIRLAGVCLGLVIAGWALTVARADGEVGLVIEHGDGTTETFCVAFSGDSISGDQLLRKAGIAVEQFSGLVCAIGNNSNEGCFGASSFDSCTCKCQGASCTYWAFFTEQYGKSWVYSSLGFRAQKARDGDLQAWRWGSGGRSSAPPPPAMTFEQVCGHAPRGGAVQPASPVTSPTASNSPAPVAAPATVAETGTSAAATSGAVTPLPPTETTMPMATITLRPQPTASTPATPAAQSEGGGSSGQVMGFVGVAAVLGAAIAGAVVWRRRHDA